MRMKWLQQYGSPVFALWVAGLALLLAVLLWVLLRSPVSQRALTRGPELAAQAWHLVRESADGYILGTLPEKDGLRNPVPLFAADAPYVLSGFGLQGLFQVASASSPWELDVPEPVIEAQLVERGPSPRVVTEGVLVRWRFVPEDNLENDKTVILESLGGEMTLNTAGNAFEAVIPLSVRDAAGLFNPYLVLSLEAVDATNGETLAQSAVTLAVGPGFGCRHCHADSRVILQTHDQRHATTLDQMAADGIKVPCYSCHMGIAVEDGKAESTGMPGFSATIHGWHAPYLKDREGDACLTCHVGLGRADIERDVAPLFLRDSHMAVGLDCTRCHGYMEDHALALLRAEQEAGLELAQARIDKIMPRAAGEAALPRLPWVQQPDCLSCHDYESKPDVATATAFNKWTSPESGEGGLFSRAMDGMDVVRCVSCHGAPHALYPAENPVRQHRDNLPPMQYQNMEGVIGSAGNCAVCHMQDMPMSAHHPIIGE